MKKEELNKNIDRHRWIVKHILEWYQEVFDKDACIPAIRHKGYDILTSRIGNVKVKDDRFAHQTKYYSFDGIGEFTAKHLIIVDWDNVVFTLTDKIRELIKTSKNKKKVVIGNRPVKDWLLPCEEVRSSPFVFTVKRWF